MALGTVGSRFMKILKEKGPDNLSPITDTEIDGVKAKAAGAIENASSLNKKGIPDVYLPFLEGCQFSLFQFPKGAYISYPSALDWIKDRGKSKTSPKSIDINLSTLKKILLKSDINIGETKISAGERVSITKKGRVNGTRVNHMGKDEDKIENYYYLSGSENPDELSEGMSISELQEFIQQHNPGDMRLTLSS